MKDPLVIKFTPGFTGHDGRLTAPVPAVSTVPEWYKSLARFDKSNDDITLGVKNNIGTDGAMVATKMCMPFFDALTGGYMYVLEDDVYVDQDEKGKPIISWKGEVMMIDKRPTIELPVPNNCHPIHYGWRMNWYYETPPGYSVLITHPMNRLCVLISNLKSLKLFISMPFDPPRRTQCPWKSKKSTRRVLCATTPRY